MNKKKFFLSILAVGFLGGLIFLILSQPDKPSNTSSTFTQIAKQDIQPSSTLTSYSDPSGFSFSYPDNLSLTNNDASSSTTYTDLKLTAKDLNGSLNLKITDSNLTSLNQWLQINSLSNPKEASLSGMKAEVVSTDNKILLGSLDSGILFTIDVPFGDKKDFWTKVYERVVDNFTFVNPTINATSSNLDSSAQDEVTYEGEEVVQ